MYSYSTRHIIFVILLSFLIMLIGTWGYMLLEGWSALDAFYMTVITFSTVGFMEVHDLSGWGRLYTTALIFLGVGFFLYVAGALIQFMVEGRIRAILGRRRLDKRIGRLKGHYIVCGYGRIGRVLCRHIRQKPVEIVVIEKDPDLIPAMEEDGVLYISGDAADETNLIKAGVDRARGLVAVLATDANNVFLVLTARQLAPGLFIMARSGAEGSKTKLKAAGANKVESPYDMGASSMAQRIIRPTVTNFLDLAFAHKREDIQMEEIPVSPHSDLNKVMLKDSGIRQNYNLIIIAIKGSDDQMVFNPHFETVLESGTTVIAVGEAKNLQRLEKILNPA